ncbi:DUF4878 domain-containing protein [Mycolicibacterium sp.]|uniref:Rv0361 family membrane protein n=1 Tax=Mycolicibacterium sp. TaxID=2320850 RepID=UPI0028AA7FA3|nr:DUF4878 domain-containing protein [Mycolicibacterium sp.]
MTEPEESRATLMPLVTAIAIVAVALISIFVLRLFLGDELPDDDAVARAVVGQNDALQRENFTDFRTFTCLAQQGAENQMLADQKQSVSAKGHRFVDDVKEMTVTGDRATATVVYHFEKAAENKIDVPMTVVRENGEWKVCSPGPK